jgi:DNA-binding transcriptional regulator YdaS (Cro superfamily)
MDTRKQNPQLEPFADFITAEGGQKNAATVLKISQGMVSKYLNGAPIPADKAIAYERLTRKRRRPLKREELRPDLWG